eukprot:Cvel_14047.t1-p1 / transcript=Cvel_14047.t1 / gene=Cvel_14047 / organism=Chromera_velia_CCMP2878 / gene_product=hypothetical protein / transcript_product=hypothetical protein / location=Cvel_scaffold984:58610-59114(+) / protein_length=52 / sequence_SO=supercontig / SO=protein_coding / is_pseudo=false
MAIPRKQGLKAQAFEKNVTKRGAVPTSTKKESNKYTVGPVVLAVFIFVVVGS